MENCETYFSSSQKNDPFVQHWHRDVKGNKDCTKSKKNDQFVESFRRWVLHAPEASVVPREVTSLGVAATNMMIDAREREIFSDKVNYERHGVDSMSRGSLPSDLGDTWHHGPPKRPRWAGGLDLGSDDHSENTGGDVREEWSHEELDRGLGGAARD